MGNTNRMTYCRDDQSGGRKETKEQMERQSSDSKTPNYLCRDIKRRTNDRELYVKGIYKEAKDARLHNKTYLVYKVIRQITARYAPQIQVIKDGQGHLLTARRSRAKVETILLTPYTMTLMSSI